MSETIEGGPIRIRLFTSHWFHVKVVFRKLLNGHDIVEKYPKMRPVGDALAWLEDQMIPYGIAWDEPGNEGYLVLNDSRSAALFALFYPDIFQRRLP